MDIYETARTKLSNKNERDGDNRSGSTCSVLSVFAAVIYWAIVRFVPNFVETFQSFGADLPWLTRTIISIYPLFLILLIGSLLLNLVWLAKVHKPKWVPILVRLAVCNFIIAVISFAVALVSMYYPIFQLGQVV